MISEKNLRAMAFLQSVKGNDCCFCTKYRTFRCPEFFSLGEPPYSYNCLERDIDEESDARINGIEVKYLARVYHSSTGVIDEA